MRPIALAVSRAVWTAMFGPGDPLISGWSQFMMQPENVSRKIQAMASPAVDKALTTQFGDKLSAERRACVRKILDSIAEGMTAKTAAGADPTKAARSRTLAMPPSRR